jgi:hypothetical protein
VLDTDECYTTIYITPEEGKECAAETLKRFLATKSARQILNSVPLPNPKSLGCKFSRKFITDSIINEIAINNENGSLEP